jgi:hypothetical protein
MSGSGYLHWSYDPFKKMVIFPPDPLDSPTLPEDEGGDATSDWNRPMGTSRQQARWGSAMSYAPPLSTSTSGVMVAVVVAVAANRMSKALGHGDGGG